MDMTVDPAVRAATVGSVSTTAVNPEATAQAPVETEAEAKKVNEDLVKYDTYRRVLGEKKKLEDKFNALMAEKEEQSRKTLEEQNNFKALYENTAKKLQEKESEIGELRDVIDTSIKTSTVMDYIAKANLRCVDYDALFALGNVDLLQLTDGNVEGVDAFVEDAHKRLPYLFPTQAIPRTANVPPAYAAGAQLTKETFLALPREDQQRYLAELTQRIKS